MLNPHNPALIASIVRNLDAIIARRPKAGDVAPAPIAPTPPDPALAEYHRVRRDAETRIAAEQKAAAEALAARQAAQAAEDRAVAMILDARTF